jgi:hypothetical protein
MSLPAVTWMQQRKKGKRNFAAALKNRDDWIARVRKRESVEHEADHSNDLIEGDEVAYIENDGRKETFSDLEEQQSDTALLDIPRLDAALIVIGVVLVLLSKVA